MANFLYLKWKLPCRTIGKLYCYCNIKPIDIRPTFLKLFHPRVFVNAHYCYWLLLLTTSTHNQKSHCPLNLEDIAGVISNHHFWALWFVSAPSTDNKSVLSTGTVKKEWTPESARFLNKREFFNVFLKFCFKIQSEISIFHL